MVVTALLGYGMGWSLFLPKRMVGVNDSCHSSGMEVATSSLLFLLASYGIGMGFLSLLMLLLGAVRLLYLPILWLVLFVGLYLFWRNRCHLPKCHEWQLLLPKTTAETLIAIFLTAGLAFHYLGCFLPAFGQDELTYHLTIPRQYLITHQVHATPNLLHGNFPYNAEMIYLFCLGLGHEMLCKQVQWSMLVVLLVTLLLTIRHLDTKAGYLGMILYFAAVGYVYTRSPMEAGSDLPITLFFALALMYLILSSHHTFNRDLTLSGIFNGLAWGTKYVAPIFVTPLVVTYLVWKLLQLRRETATVERCKLPSTWRSLSWFFCLNLLLFAPWMTKNTLCTGNPLYPMFTGIFPSPPPYDGIAARLFTYERRSNFYLSLDEKMGSAPTTADHHALTWRTFSFRLMQGYLGKLKWSVYEGDYLLFLFIMASIAGLFWKKGVIRGLALAGVFANLIFLFIYGAHLNRFFSVTYPLAAILSAIVLNGLLRRTSRPTFLSGVVGILLFGNMINFQLRWCELLNWYGKPYLTKASHEDFVRRFQTNPEQEGVMKAIPELVLENGFILGHGVRLPYAIPRKIYCICDYEEELLSELERQHPDWKGIAEDLKEMGFTHLILKGASPAPQPWLDQYTELLRGVEGLEIRKFIFP
jgi:hypothetical protein